MITYKGTPMLSRQDWIENADKLDPEFADALDEYLGNCEELIDENEYWYKESQKFENEAGDLKNQLAHYESLKIGVVMKQNEDLLTSLKEVRQMLATCKGVESIIKVRLKKALDYIDKTVKEIT